MIAPVDSRRSRRRSSRYSCARIRASVTGDEAPHAFSNASSPSITQIVVWNEERTEPRSASQFHPPSASCSLSSRSTSRSLRSPKYAPRATTRPLMHGSTSPSKKGEFPNPGPQVTLRRTRSIAARARSPLGSSPRSRKKTSVYMFDHQNGVATPSPHWPSGRCCSSSRRPHPSKATCERTVATSSAVASVRSRITCQRLDGSASSNQLTTGSRSPEDIRLRIPELAGEADAAEDLTHFRRLGSTRVRLQPRRVPRVRERPKLIHPDHWPQRIAGLRAPLANPFFRPEEQHL